MTRLGDGHGKARHQGSAPLGPENVPVGPLYRRFPKRSDLIVGVFCQQVDACAAAAAECAAEYAPGEALAHWAQRYADFISTKRGLATALHSGDPAFQDLPSYFEKHLISALQSLLDAARAAGDVTDRDVKAFDLLRAIGGLCMAAQDDGMEFARRMVKLLIDGLRGSSPSSASSTTVTAD